MTKHRQISNLVSVLVSVFVVLFSVSGFAQITVPESARGTAAEDKGNPRVEGKLLVDHSRVQPGDSFYVGLLFELDPQWHLYWKNSGDSGLSPRLSFEAKSIDFGPLKWPGPSPYLESGGELLTYGYGEEVLLFSKARLDNEAKSRETITAEVDFLTCKVDCIPGHFQLKRTLEIGSSRRNDDEVKYFDQYKNKLPVAAKRSGIQSKFIPSQKPIRPGDTFQLAVVLDYCFPEQQKCAEREIVSRVKKGAFMPASAEPIEWETRKIVANPDTEYGQVLIIEGRASADLKVDSDYRLEGLVKLKTNDGETQFVELTSRLPTGSSNSKVEAISSSYFETQDKSPQKQSAAASKPTGDEKEASPDISIMYALLLAFIGGMLLNIMPCVFPVLALKVTAFAKIVHHSRRQIYAHAGAYTLGIVGSMCALATIVVGLKMAGIVVGWGFQFQQPLFIVGLSALLVIFAMNLFDVFQISVSADKLSKTTEKASGIQRSFLEGILAVILATPCSAPFLGTAVGFALTGSTTSIFAVFAVIGLGLAAPFVALVAVPGWKNYLPSPGEWMNIVKEIMGFLLVGTAIWLLWILGQTTGPSGVIWTLVFLTFIAFSSWIFGKLQYRLRPVSRFGLIALLAVVLAGVGYKTLEFESYTPAASTTSQNDGLSWRTWSDQNVQKALANDNPVFVDFTADWCITCKVNERTVIDTPKIKEAIDEYDVQMFKADWTERDKRIRKKLAEFGKAGVPMYLFYSPENPKSPKLLSENLTQQALLSAFQGE